MRYLPLFILLVLSCSSSTINASEKGDEMMRLSVDFIETLKLGNSTDAIVKRYAELDLDTLAAGINTEEEKLAFWINTYNGFVQHVLIDDASLFEDRGKFFSSDQLIIAGKEMSLDDIEHGIIRSSKWKLSLGYVRNPFAAKHIRMLRTESPDGRVHFALNCGAASCPEIASYHAGSIDKELDFIAEQYLKKTTKVNEESVTVTPLMSWFRGDFGGKKGIKRDFLLHYNVVDDIEDVQLEFGDYDWTLSLGNYTDIELND